MIDIESLKRNACLTMLKSQFNLNFSEVIGMFDVSWVL